MPEVWPVVVLLALSKMDGGMTAVGRQSQRSWLIGSGSSLCPAALVKAGAAKEASIAAILELDEAALANRAWVTGPGAGRQPPGAGIASSGLSQRGQVLFYPALECASRKTATSLEITVRARAQLQDAATAFRASLQWLAVNRLNLEMPCFYQLDQEARGLVQGRVQPYLPARPGNGDVEQPALLGEWKRIRCRHRQLVVPGRPVSGWGSRVCLPLH